MRIPFAWRIPVARRGRSTIGTEKHAAAFLQITLVLGIAFASVGTSTSAILVSPPHSPPATSAPETLRFDTDDCGTLKQIENTDSMVRKTSAKMADDDADEDDDDPDGSQNAWGMSDMGSTFVHQWLLDNPYVVVVTDTVQRACPNATFNDEDALEIA